MEEYKSELIELGFNIDSIGILYWVEAIKIILKNPMNFEMGDIYKKIATKYISTNSRVERAMRHCIEPAEKNIQDKYNYHYKIKNNTYLNLIRFKLI